LYGCEFSYVVLAAISLLTYGIILSSIILFP
jgi:hypothetical protein